MMRRPPPRPGLGKKASSGFKITYSVTQLLNMGKDSVSKEPGCAPLEGWEKYQYDKIGPIHQEDGNSRPAQATTKEYLATLVMRPGSARDLHAEHLAALAAKQAQEPEHSSLGPRGGGTMGAGIGWGDRDRERDRYGDRNKDRDRGLSRFDHDRDRRGDGGRRDRVRDAQQPSGRPPSRWDALKPDRDRDRGYNNRSNRDSRDRDDGDELGGGSRQDARLGGGRDRDRDGRHARAADSVRDGGLAAHDRALANERAAAAGGGGGRERDRDRLGGGGSGGRDRYGGAGGGMSNEADIWDMPTSALPGVEGASKDPPRNSRAAGLKSAEREQRERNQKAEEVREFQAKKLMFEKELERERAAYKQQGQLKGAAAAPNGDATGFPDMGGGFLDGNDEDGSGDGNNDLLGVALEESPSATPTRDNGNEDGSATRLEGEEPERDAKQEARGSFLDGFLGGGGREGSSSGGGVITTAGSEPRGGGGVAGGRSGADGTGGGGFPGGGLFSFMAPGNSISTIDKFTEVTRGGAGKIFSPDSTAARVLPSRLSPWEKTENKTAKAAAAAAAPGGGGAGGSEGSTTALSAAEKSALLKRMIMGGGAGAPRMSEAPSPQQAENHRPAADGLGGHERGSLLGNGSALVEARSPVVGSEGGVAVVGEKVEGGGAAGGQTRVGGASTAEVDMLMQKLAVARLPENQRREAFKQAQKERELQQHYQKQQQQQQQQPIGDGRSSPLSMPSQPPRNPFGSPPPSVVGQPEPPAGLPPSLSTMGSSSPPLGGIAFRASGQMPLAGGNGAEGLMGPSGTLPTNNGQQPKLGVDFAVEEARRRQLQQQQLRQQQLQLNQQQRERERQVDQYRHLQIHQQQQKLDREHQRLEHHRLEQQRQQDLRHRQEQLQLEQQQAAMRQRQQQQQQQQRRYAAEATGVPITPGSHVLQQQQLLRQRQFQMQQQQQQQQQMHIRQHPHAHQQHVPRGSAVSGVRVMQGLPVARSLLQQRQQQRQLVGDVSVEGGSHLSPVGGPIVMPQGQQHAGYPQAGRPVARQPQQQGVGGYPGVTGGGHLQQRMGPQQQPPPSISPVTMAHGGGGDGTNTNIINTSAEFPSRTRAEDLLSVLGLQKTPADFGAGQAGYGGGGDLSASGSGGGHQFAFHEPQPGARRARAMNGMGGSMALDPRARARAIAGGMGVGPGIGIGGRKMAMRPGGAPGQMTADEMDRIVTGN